MVSTAVSPWGVAVVGSYVFFNDNGINPGPSLWRAPAAGGAPVILYTYMEQFMRGAADLVTDGSEVAVWGIAFGDTMLGGKSWPWIDIYRFDVSSPSSTPVVPSGWRTGWWPLLAVDSGNVYSVIGPPLWTGSPSYLTAAWANETTLANVGTTGFPAHGPLDVIGGILSTSCKFFFTGTAPNAQNNGDVTALGMLSLTSGNALSLVPVTKRGRLAADAAFLYWIDGTTINRAPMPN
jgi:hypothetical protein